MRAARHGKTIGQLIEEGLVEAEEAARDRITKTLELAWAHADAVRPRLTEDELMDEANAIVHEIRAGATPGQSPRGE